MRYISIEDEQYNFFVLKSSCDEDKVKMKEAFVCLAVHSKKIQINRPTVLYDHELKNAELGGRSSASFSSCDLIESQGEEK